MQLNRIADKYMEKLEQYLQEWLFNLNHQQKRALKILFDAVAVPTAFVLALYVRLETTDFLHYNDTYVGILISLISVFGVYATRGFYNSFIRHMSIETAYSIAISSLVACAALLSATLLLNLQIPRSVPMIFALMFFVLSTGVLLLIRALGQKVVKGNKENIAIYGAGATGIQLMYSIRYNQNYRLRMFIDDDPKLNRKTFDGIPIHSLERAKEEFKKLKIDTLLLSIVDDIDDSYQRIFNFLPDRPIKVKKIPSISQLISGASVITDFKDIKIEDLLGRAPVQHDPDLMAKNIRGKNVLVSGAGGSIGSELCRQIIRWQPKQLILLDISEYSIYTILEELELSVDSEMTRIVPLIGSVQDRRFLKSVFDKFNIDTTYHAAAYKHVPLMEHNVMQCILNNVFGTLNLVEIAVAAECKNFILISTDKAVRPTNFMGASKRFAEIICQTFDMISPKTCFGIVRFGNVLGSSGSVVPLFKRQIKKGGPLTITHPDITRYFMTITEAAQLVIQAGSIARGGEVFVLDMGKPVKIMDLAQKMIALSGLRPIWTVDSSPNPCEILIKISGLRPGEKLFEELSHTENLIGTIHPRIKTTAETPMNIGKLRSLLTDIENAICDDEQEKLYSLVSSVTKDIADISRSSDFFIKNIDENHSSVVPIKLQNT